MLGKSVLTFKPNTAAIRFARQHFLFRLLARTHNKMSPEKCAASQRGGWIVEERGA